ncbi:unnamed protein product [Urochloa humidicola]
MEVAGGGRNRSPCSRPPWSSRSSESAPAELAQRTELVVGRRGRGPGGQGELPARTTRPETKPTGVEPWSSSWSGNETSPAPARRGHRQDATPAAARRGHRPPLLAMVTARTPPP